MQPQNFKSTLRSTLVYGFALSLSLVLLGCDGGNDPSPVVSNDLQGQQFIFNDGTPFGFDNAEVTLQYGIFNGNAGTFTLSAPMVTATGDVMIGSCNHTVTTTDNEAILPVGTEINCPTCNVQSDGSLSVACGPANAVSSSSPGTGAGGYGGLRVVRGREAQSPQDQPAAAKNAGRASSRTERLLSQHIGNA